LNIVHNIIFLFIYRLRALEDRFHDLEGQQAHSTKSEQQKYAEYIVNTKNLILIKQNNKNHFLRIKKIEHFFKKKKSYNQGNNSKNLFLTIKKNSFN